VPVWPKKTKPGTSQWLLRCRGSRAESQLWGMRGRPPPTQDERTARPPRPRRERHAGRTPPTAARQIPGRRAAASVIIRAMRHLVATLRVGHARRLRCGRSRRAARVPQRRSGSRGNWPGRASAPKVPHEPRHEPQRQAGEGGGSGIAASIVNSATNAHAEKQKTGIPRKRWTTKRWTNGPRSREKPEFRENGGQPNGGQQDARAKKKYRNSAKTVDNQTVDKRVAVTRRSAGCTIEERRRGWILPCRCPSPCPLPEGEGKLGMDGRIAASPHPALSHPAASGSRERRKTKQHGRPTFTAAARPGSTCTTSRCGPPVALAASTRGRRPGSRQSGR